MFTSLKDLWRELVKLILKRLDLLELISGQSTVMSQGEQGNWIDITFNSNRPIQLVKATWDWTGKNVWLDRDGSFFTIPENRGVTSYQFHFGNTPPDVDTQVFGFTATGFDSGDYFKFTMDLDRNKSGETPLTSDYSGGKLKLEFSDGTVIDDVFDAAANEPWGAKAQFNFGVILRKLFQLQPTKAVTLLAGSEV